MQGDHEELSHEQAERVRLACEAVEEAFGRKLTDFEVLNVASYALRLERKRCSGAASK